MKLALDEIPWGRFGQLEEVAALAAFLASAEADLSPAARITLMEG